MATTINAKESATLGKVLEPVVIDRVKRMLAPIGARDWFAPELMARWGEDRYGNKGQPYFPRRRPHHRWDARPLDAVIAVDLRPEGVGRIGDPFEPGLPTILAIEATTTCCDRTLARFRKTGELSDIKRSQVANCMMIAGLAEETSEGAMPREVVGSPASWGEFALDGVIVAMLNPLTDDLCVRLEDRGKGYTRFGYWGSQEHDDQITHDFHPNTHRRDTSVSDCINHLLERAST